MRLDIFPVQLRNIICVVQNNISGTNGFAKPLITIWFVSMRSAFSYSVWFLQRLGNWTSMLSQRLLVISLKMKTMKPCNRNWKKPSVSTTEKASAWDKIQIYCIYFKHSESQLLQVLTNATLWKQRMPRIKRAIMVFVGNGYITTGTLREILKALDDKLTSDDLDGIIAEIDTDGSGTVDFDGMNSFKCPTSRVFPYNHVCEKQEYQFHFVRFHLSLRILMLPFVPMCS